MKRKLLVTLVASALELYAASAGAQVASCNFASSTAKSVNGSTPVFASALNPVNGFPEYVTDSNQQSFVRCLDPAFCFFDPIVETDPFSLQIGSGGEAFYWGADAILNDPAGTPILKIVMAAETAFLQEGPNAEPINGSQFAFMRLRIVFDAPADGQYVLRHPYGSEYFEINGATGNRDFVTSYDIGLLPSPNGTQSKVGPFMRTISAPPGFAGDINVLDQVDPLFGSPCGWNFVELSGVNPVTGAAIDFGGGQTVLTVTDFAIQGQNYDGIAQTAMTADRLTYSRTAAGGAVEAFATSSNLASVTIENGPTNGLSPSLVRGVETLGQSVFTTAPTQSTNSGKVVTAADSVIPQVLSLTGTAVGSKATKLNVTTVDFVDIAQADFDPATNTLTVVANSGDAVTPPTLTLREFGDFTAGNPVYTVVTAAPPALVTVDSLAGGSATAKVRVTPALPPAAPTALAASNATARTVTLSWDATNVTNETGFNVYTVDGLGVRSVNPVASTAANVTTVTVSGLNVATAYTFVVEAFNNVGGTPSDTLTASTLALPAAPASASFVASTTVQNRLDVSWAATADATDYQVYRITGTGVTATTALIATVTGTTYPDLGRSGNTTYQYQVLARRTIAGVTDVAATRTSSNTITTVGIPTSANVVTAVVSPTVGNTVNVGWADRATNEVSYQVYRRLSSAPVGSFLPVSDLLPSGSVSFPDLNVPNGGYTYRVDVSNWAGTVQSANQATATVSVATLNAPTNVSVTNATRPVVRWTDATTGETGYRVNRTPFSFAGGVFNAGAVTTLSAAANATTLTEAAGAVTANGLYGYSVQAMNGTTAGPASATVYAMPGLLPTVTAAASTTRNGPNRVTWSNATGSSVVITVQKCVGTCNANSTWTNLTPTFTTNTFLSDSAVTRGTTYSYRVISRTANNPATGAPYVTATSAIATARAN